MSEFTCAVCGHTDASAPPERVCTSCGGPLPDPHPDVWIPAEAAATTCEACFRTDLGWWHA